MTTIEITRFNSGKRGYSKADAGKLPISTFDRFENIVQHVENAIAQIRIAPNAPTGISFAAYKGTRCVNTDSNINEVYALALDYKLGMIEQVAEAAERLGYAHLIFITENRAKTENAVSLVIPFTSPLSVSQYARVASCIATELDTYGLLEGALAATHIINIHATTTHAFVRGRLFDAEAYIKRTAKQFQGMDARKYERNEPISRQAAQAQLNCPTFTTDDGLFEFPLSRAEVKQLEADALLATIGVKL